MRRLSLSNLSPNDGIGTALSQTPAPGALTSRSRLRETGDEAPSMRSLSLLSAIDPNSFVFKSYNNNIDNNRTTGSAQTEQPSFPLTRANA